MLLENYKILVGNFNNSFLESNVRKIRTYWINTKYVKIRRRFSLEDNCECFIQN